jgi:peptidoglycan/xylan/chitin deacetylase (PgdA/CDA1 family)
MLIAHRSSFIAQFLAALLLVSSSWALEGAGPKATSSRVDSSAPDDLSDRAVVLMFDDGWHSAFTNAYPLLRAHQMTAVLPLISSYVGIGQPRYASNPYTYMNRAEIQEMIDNLGVEIVSHTRTHPFLTRLTNDAAMDELVSSRRALEAMFHQKITALVYPYGDYDRRIRGLVQDAGYALARSIHPGRLDFNDRPFDLPATEVTRTTSLDFVTDRIRNRAGLILFFHRIVPSPAHRTDWSTSHFAELLEWLDDHQVQVMTLTELYERYQGRLPEPPRRRRSWRNRVEWELLQKVDVNLTGTAEFR